MVRPYLAHFVCLLLIFNLAPLPDILEDLDEKQFSNHQTNFTLGWDYAGQIIDATVENRILEIDHFPNEDLAVLIQSERVGCGLQNQMMGDSYSSLLLRIQPDGTCVDGVSISGPANWRLGSLSVSQGGEIWMPRHRRR